MKSKLKKTLSLLLALVMCLSVMSVGAFAQGETSYTVTFQMTDSVGRLLLVDVDANYSAGNPYTNVSGTWYNGQYNENTRVAFTQTVTSGGFATKPTDTPYYGYGMPQPNNGDPKQFTADDSHAYTFDGWATEDGKLYDFTKPVTADLTLHPRFSTTGATITISNEDELLNFAEEVRRGRRFNGHGIQQTVQLSSDITLTNNETPNWTPISDTTFQGNFDGNNHSISGLYVTGTYEKVGFFKVLTSSNTVSNLTLIAPKVSSTSSYVGALAGEMNATTVTNCHVTGAMDISGLNNVGGLFGHVTNGANIVNCTVDGSNSAVIAATENTASEQGRMVGGLIGNTDGTVVITNCSVSGVTAQGWRKIGGLIGQAAKITATNVSVSDVTLQSNADTSFASHLTMGGLVGIFANTYANSSISGTVSDVTMTGPANIAEGKNYVMGLVSGGTGGTVEAAETAMTGANMTFDVTVSGTNSCTVPNNCDYEGIYGSYVAQIVDGNSYETLEAAIANATTDNTVKLLNNVTLSDSIDINKALTIDLNGHSITGASGKNVFMLTSGANMLVKDSGETKGGIMVTGNDAFRLDNQGDTKADATAVKLTIESDVNVVSTTDCAVFFRGSVTLNTAGNLSAHGVYAAIQGNGSDTYATTVITVSGGSVSAENSLAIYFPNPGTLNISGGNLTGEKSAVEIRAGNLNVTGGTFTATATEYSCSANGNGPTTTGAALAIAQHTTKQDIKVNITGGEYNVSTQEGATAVKLSIANPQNNAFDNVEVSGKTALFSNSVKVPTLYYWDTTTETSSLTKLPGVTYAGSNGYFADVFVLNFYVKADSEPTFGVTREGEALDETTSKEAFFSANKAVFFAEKVLSTTERNSLGIKNAKENNEGNDYYMVSVKYFTKNLAKAVTLKMTVGGNTVEVNTRSFLDYLRNMSNGSKNKQAYQNLYEGLTKAAQGASAFTN